MPDAYEVHDGRFVQEVLVTSAADALTLASAVCPAGRVRTYLGIGYYPSASETRTVIFHMVGRGGLYFPLIQPISVALDSVYQILTPLTEGNELKTFPGDYLRVVRGVATAGSTMNMCVRFIDTDLPYYKYTDPLNPIVQSKHAHGSVFRSSGGISIGSPRSGGGGRDGGRGGPEPI